MVRQIQRRWHPQEVPRVSLPFQVIETINESRAKREARNSGLQMSLFDVYEGKEGDTFEEGWKTNSSGATTCSSWGHCWKSLQVKLT